MSQQVNLVLGGLMMDIFMQMLGLCILHYMMKKFFVDILIVWYFNYFVV